MLELLTFVEIYGIIEYTILKGGIVIRFSNE